MNSIVITILSLSLSGSILALILFMGKPLLKDKVSKTFSYYIWLLVLLRLIVPISAPVNVTNTLLHFEQSSLSDVLPGQTGSSVVNSTDQNAGLSTAASGTQTKSSQDGDVADTQKSAETQQTFSLRRFIQGNLLWLWLAGAVVSFGWFSIAYAIYLRRIRHSYTALRDDDLSVFEHLRGKMHVRIVCSSHVTTPMCIGFLRPVIVLPQIACVRNGMEQELKDILRHELTHCRRKDILYKWLVITVTSLHWFNPLMILIRRETGRACELSCDEAVIRNMSKNEKQLYGNTLLTFSAGERLPAGILATTLCEGKEQLKERLITIKHYKTQSTLAVALALILALLLTGCATALGVADISGSGATLNTKISPSDVAAPLQSIAGDMLKTCNFPVALPTYLPSPSDGNDWSASPDVKSNTFSIEMYQLPLGDTSQARSQAEWYGVISGNVGEPSEQPVEKQFVSSNIKANDIILPNGISGKEYIDNPDVAGGTAITWEASNWSFFVSAYPENTSGSTMNYADQIINAIKDSGQTLPGSQGKFYFIYNGNMPMTEVYWDIGNGTWYELDLREPSDAIKILQSMKILDANEVMPGSEDSKTALNGSSDITPATSTATTDAAPRIIDSVDAEWTEKYDDIVINNEWISADEQQIAFFGSLKSDSQQGVIEVIFMDDSGNNTISSEKRYLSPAKHGALKASEIGAKDFTLSVSHVNQDL